MTSIERRQLPRPFTTHSSVKRMRAYTKIYTKTWKFAIIAVLFDDEFHVFASAPSPSPPTFAIIYSLISMKVRQAGTLNHSSGFSRRDGRTFILVPRYCAWFVSVNFSHPVPASTSAADSLSKREISSPWLSGHGSRRRCSLYARQ